MTKMETNNNRLTRRMKISKNMNYSNIAKPNRVALSYGCKTNFKEIGGQGKLVAIFGWRIVIAVLAAYELGTLNDIIRISDHYFVFRRECAHCCVRDASNKWRQK